MAVFYYNDKHKSYLHKPVILVWIHSKIGSTFVFIIGQKITMQETKVGLRAHIWNHCLSQYYGINACTAFKNVLIYSNLQIFRFNMKQMPFPYSNPKHARF